MIRHMRHGSPPRLMALQSILSPNRRESLPTPSAGVRITPVSAAQRILRHHAPDGPRIVVVDRQGRWSCWPTVVLLNLRRELLLGLMRQRRTLLDYPKEDFLDLAKEIFFALLFHSATTGLCSTPRLQKPCRPVT